MALRELVIMLAVSVGAHADMQALDQGKQADQESLFVAVLTVRQRNLHLLESECKEVSDPASPKRGQYASFHQVGKLIQNLKGLEAVKAWIALKGLEVVAETLFGEYIMVRGQEQQLQRAFEWSSPASDHESKHGAAKILSVPKDLNEHVLAVLGIYADHVGPNSAVGHTEAYAPFGISEITDVHTVPVAPGYSKNFGRYNGTATPQVVRSFYGVGNEMAAGISQDIFSGNQNWTLPDLQAFRGHFGLDRSIVPESIGNFSIDPYAAIEKELPCNSTSSSWAGCSIVTSWRTEASLDVQYMTAMAQGAATRVHTYDLGKITNQSTANLRLEQALVDWIVKAANTSDTELALVHSISYGLTEDAIAVGLMEAFNTEAMKLCWRGVSILVAAGDGGVCQGHGSTTCEYSPVFPASSPYVTSIGGTMGPESNLPEIVANVADGGAYNAGGGFSKLFPTPWYQKTAVSAYVDGEAIKASMPGYNAAGRGYPDLAGLSNNFAIVINGMLFTSGGTSAASPSIAGLFSLVNSRRLADGRPSVGFVNPTLYAAGSEACCHDVTKGANKCTWEGPSFANCSQQAAAFCTDEACGINATVSCLPTTCKAGFEASVGWDPAAGLGSPKYQRLLDLFSAVQKAVMV